MQHKGELSDGYTTPGTGRVMFRGYSVAAGGSAVVVNFRETNVSGEILAQVKVAANDSKDSVVEFDSDGPIYVQFVSGTPSNVTLYWE